MCSNGNGFEADWNTTISGALALQGLNLVIGTYFVAIFKDPPK
jgi:hypothetical protein